ncbi:MAG TPA: tetratricopeptide repeat protein [Thermoanaerobaculia bacterium]
MRPFHAGPSGLRILGLVLLIAASGCAYYNTFYLAKKYYREGTRAQEKSLTDEPSPEAATKYDLVIRQCTKVLTDYPKSKWVDDASYMMGAALYGKRDYAAAMTRFQEFPTKFPKSPYLADARYMEGLSQYRRKEYLVADSIFRDVDTRFPKFPRRWELYYYAGETQSQLKYYAAAAYWYDRALSAAKARHEHSDALRRLGDTYVLADRPDTAVVLYARCLKVEDRGKTRLDVAFSRGDALRKMRKYQEALDFFQEWKVFASAESREGELGLRIYECMALLGRVNEAIGGYRNLIQKFPRTSVAYDAQFRIGYLYESELQDFDGAAREYDLLRNSPQSEFSTQALRRAQNLSTLRQFRTALASDTTQTRAGAAFMMAELYYFQLEKPESALIQYRRVEWEFPRSVYAAKSAYARLWIAAHDRGDTLGAMALTDSIAKRYRGTRYAESALYLWKRWSGRTDARTALFDSLLANPDTSRAAWFEPEVEARLLMPPVDTVAVDARQGYRAAPEDSARIDSLRALARKLTEERLKARGKVKE